MKIKKMLLAVLVFGWVAFFSTAASAQWGWFRCTINSAGPEGGTFYVTLTGDEIDGSGSLSGDRFCPFIWFDKSQRKDMIATILTAVAANKTVDVLVSVGAEPSLFAVYINP